MKSSRRRDLHKTIATLDARKRPGCITSAFILKCALVGVSLSGICFEPSSVDLSLIVNARAIRNFQPGTILVIWISICRLENQLIQIYAQAAWKALNVSLWNLWLTVKTWFYWWSPSRTTVQDAACKDPSRAARFFMLEQVNKDERGSRISRAQLLSEPFISRELKKLTQPEASKTRFIC